MNVVVIPLIWAEGTPCVKQGGSAIKIYGNSKFEKVARFFEIRNIISQKLSLVEQKGAQFVITDLWFPT